MRVVLRDDSVATGATIGGKQSIGVGEGTRQARPLMHLGVIRQGVIGFGDGGGQFGIGAVRSMWPEQGEVARQRFAVNEGLGDVAALGEFRLDPLKKLGFSVGKLARTILTNSKTNRALFLRVPP